jgi:DNA-binding MarR family transcriptional regulator
MSEKAKQRATTARPVKPTVKPTPAVPQESYYDFINQSGQVSHVPTRLPRTAMRQIQRIAARLRAGTERVASAYGIHVNDMYVLFVLERSPDHSKTVTELKSELSYTSGGMTKRLDRLETQGLVERLPHPTDRRAWVIRLTQAGLHMFERINTNSKAKGLGLEVSSIFDEKEWQRLVDCLARFDQTLEAGGYRLSGE